jgi:hypothetical protein
MPVKCVTVLLTVVLSVEERVFIVDITSTPSVSAQRLSERTVLLHHCY